MREAEEIRKGLLNMLAEDGMVFQATVTEVNEEEFTCTVVEDEIVTYYDVRLRSVINPELNGIAMIPKPGSYVLVCRIGKSNELFVCMFSEIDKVIFSNENISFMLDNEKVKADVNGTTIDATETGIAIENIENKVSCKMDSRRMELDVDGNTINISDSTITFNEGKNEGLVKIKELTEKINSFISTYNNHTHTIEAGKVTGTGSGKSISTGATVEILGANLTAIVPDTTNKCSDFIQGSYENTNIKH